MLKEIKLRCLLKPTIYLYSVFDLEFAKKKIKYIVLLSPLDFCLTKSIYSRGSYEHKKTKKMFANIRVNCYYAH